VTGAVIYVGRFIVLSSGASCICVLHWSEGKRGMSIVGLLPVESVHLARSQRLPLRQRHWTKLNCWTHDYWLFGGKVGYVTPLQNLPQLNWGRLILSLHHYQCQETVQIFRWPVETLASCLADSFRHNTHQISNGYWEEKNSNRTKHVITNCRTNRIKFVSRARTILIRYIHSCSPHLEAVSSICDLDCHAIQLPSSRAIKQF
jgi:hypothetical protein